MEHMPDGWSPPAGALSVIAPSGLGFAGGAQGQSLGVPLPFQNRIVLLEGIHVAGTTHVPDIDALAAKISAGDELSLQRDPDNLHDRWAVRVYAHGSRVGYLPCDCNEVVARLMDGGKRIGAKAVSLERRGRWHKIDLEVYLDD